MHCFWKLHKCEIWKLFSFFGIYKKNTICLLITLKKRKRNGLTWHADANVHSPLLTILKKNTEKISWIMVSPFVKSMGENTTHTVLNGRIKSTSVFTKHYFFITSPNTPAKYLSCLLGDSDTFAALKQEPINKRYTLNSAWKQASEWRTIA